MRKMLWLIGLLCPMLACGDANEALHLNRIDSGSRMFCASSMAYFDPRERDLDSRGLAAAHYQLAELETLVVQLGNPESLRRPLLTLRQLFENLDRLPRSQSAQYPVLVRQLLEAGRDLQSAVGQVPAKASDNAWAAELGAQSQAIAKLLLDYQLRRYPLPQPEAFRLTDGEVQRLDTEVAQRFMTLQADYPQQASVLAKIDTSFRFVRNQLRKRNGNPSGGVEFYLGRVVSELDELAAMPQD